MDEAPDMGSVLERWLDAAWAMAAQERTVGVEGADVRYRGWGLDAPVDRPGLIFVHGFMAHARWWDHIAPHFADRFRVAATNLTGMGDSDRRPAYSRRQYAREILAVARDAGMERVTIVGHSFGSVSSLYAAKSAPDLVRHVVVIDADVFRAEDDGAASRHSGEASPPTAERRYASRDEALARYRLVPPGLWPNARILDYLARYSVRETDGGWGWKFDPEISRQATKERIRDELRGVPVPSSFIHGGDSEVVGEEEIANFRAHAPGCRGVVTVPLSHHHIMIEQPVGLVAALNGILESL
ncbi:MAG: alpha/beta hydrolase [Sphingobium sp.]